MKQFLLGFAEGYFIVSLIIYIATYLILKNPNLHRNVFDFEKSNQYPILSRNLPRFIWALLSRI